MERPPPDPHEPDVPRTAEEEDADDTPFGAIFVTTVVFLAIAVSWFGMYALNVIRS